jgi:hypothetical protein
MSDFMTADQMAEIQARDRRFATINLGIEVEAELRAGRPLRLLMVRLREDADAAMQEFATANPAETAAIIGLQARVFRFQYIFDTLNAILTRGQVAEAAVRGEDMQGHERPND